MADPWCLFLTTDARNENVSPEVIEALSEAIRQNALASEAFRNGATGVLGVDGETFEDALGNANADPRRFLNKFSLGFSKWLLHNANEQGWDLKTKVSFCYSTRPAENEQVSMPCLAFEFRKQPVFMNDLFEAVQNPEPQHINAPDYSMIALQRVQQMIDLDEHFNANDDLRAEFAQKQRQLLVGAGYSPEAIQAFDDQFLGAG